MSERDDRQRLRRLTVQGWTWRVGGLVSPISQKHSQGYVAFACEDDHPMAAHVKPKESGTTFVLEHRLVAAESHNAGRPLDREALVHHKNHNRKDNRASNLHVCANAKEHAEQHKEEDAA